MHKIDPIRRFGEKATFQENGCWKWTAYINPDGYGIFCPEHGRLVFAHQFAYKSFRAPIPDGLELDHLCRNRSCVNPWHLELTTHLVNVQRGKAGLQQRTRTHCSKGHPFDSNNTYFYNDGQKRGCLICRRQRSKEHRLRRRAHALV